jgi:hypothetical protein
MSLKLLTLALATLASTTPLVSPLKAVNDNDPCKPCQPSGATGLDPPAVGSDLANMYTNVLSTVKDIHFKKTRSLTQRDSTSGFCCRASLSCVNLASANIPMCYDKFTTNYGFADGSYGSLTTGEYKAANGDSANLLTGDATVSGKQANIYSNDQAAKPNTATLSVPPQYTQTGVGSAVPPGQLGSIIVYTTTIPATTYAGPTTLPGSVRVKTAAGGVVVSETLAPSTITGATTLAAKTSVVTSTAAVDESAPAASKTGAAGRVGYEGGVGVLGAVVYALYAL